MRIKDTRIQTKDSTNKFWDVLPGFFVWDALVKQPFTGAQYLSYSAGKLTSISSRTSAPIAHDVACEASNNSQKAINLAFKKFTGILTVSLITVILTVSALTLTKGFYGRYQNISTLHRQCG
jgi:hypothetical protein